MSLAYFASPVDFEKNEVLEKKRKDAQKDKLSLNILKQMAQPKEEEIQKIHENASSQLKEENQDILSDYYQNEMKQDLKSKIAEEAHNRNLYKNEKMNTDFLISNNINTNAIVPKGSSYSNNELLSKLNYIIQMFEEQQEIKTNQKNEEVVLYCFLGIFVIYVLDSFVYIGQYKR